MATSRELLGREQESNFYIEMYKDFGVSEEDEIEYFKNKEREYDSAVELSLKRSFENIRIQLYWVFYRTDKKKELLSKIKEEVGEVGKDFSLGYCAHIDVALEVLNADNIKTGQDLFEEAVQGGREQELCYKGRTAIDYHARRTEVEQRLGWSANEVLTMGVDDEEDLRINGSSGCWGPVRFEFDYQELEDKCTYTIGDSMSHNKGTSVKSEAEDRQVAFIHITLAKAVHNILEEARCSEKDFYRGKKRSGSSYIEAQIPKKEVKGNKNLKKIIIDKKRFLDEVKLMEEMSFNQRVFKAEYGYDRVEVEFVGGIDGRFVLKSEVDNPNAPEVVQIKQLTEEEEDKIWDEIVASHLRPFEDYGKKKGIAIEFV